MVIFLLLFEIKFISYILFFIFSSNIEFSNKKNLKGINFEREKNKSKHQLRQSKKKCCFLYFTTNPIKSNLVVLIKTK